MFGKFFGSKNKSAAVDDELSQLESTPSNDKKVVVDPKNSASLIGTIPKSLHFLDLDQFTSVKLATGEYSDKASTLLPLVSHRVQCHVTYPIVQVVSTMTFCNQNQKTIEGELLLPMPDGATLIGYAMEVDGQLIDAVPVPKEKAKEVFEAEVRAGNKVSMVEKVSQSNSFKTRVYPLPYNKDKTIQVKYQMMLNEIIEKSNDSQKGKIRGSAWVPMSYLNFGALRDDTKIEFTLNQTSLQGFETEVLMGVANAETQSVEDKLLWTSKNASSRTGYFELKKSELNENMTGFKLAVTKQSEDVRDILLASENGYFMTSIPVPQLSTELREMSRIGGKIQIVWDCSNSNQSQHEKNLKTLKVILEGIAPTSISLSAFSADVIQSVDFTSVAEVLKFVKDELYYDGGSNMLLFDKDLLNKSVDYCIAFTDGVHTFGHEISPLANFEKPIYFVTCGNIVNSPLLKHIATKSGGVYLNSNELTEVDLVKSIGKPVLSFAVADFEDSDLEEVYPNEPVSLKEGEVFKLFGKFKNSGKESVKIAVSFRFGSSIYHVQELELPVNLEQCEAAVLPLLWAQQKIDSLSAFPHLFKDEIKKIGQDFRIVTEDSTLLVLETLDQYLKHDIVPPQTLANVYKQYSEMKKNEKESEEKREKDKIERILSMWKERVNWHNRDFTPRNASQKQDLCKDECEEEFAGSAPQFERLESDDLCLREEAAEFRSCGKKSKKKGGISLGLSLSKRRSESSSGGGGEDRKKDKKEKKSEAKSTSESASGSISIKAWSPDASYCKEIAKSSNPYKEYLKQRKSYKDSPAFYLDVADYFLSSVKDFKLGVRILSNICELELENIQLYRIVAYRLDQADALELSEWLFEKVKKIAPHEPQSYRDLALVKERLGKYEESMQLFNKVITGKWDMRFDEIEMTAATEMNHLLLKQPDLPIIDPRFIHHFDLDIRISMAWDTDQVDIVSIFY